MSSARITYSQRRDAKPEQERNVLACVYKLCLERSPARKGGCLPDESGLDDGTKIKEVSASADYNRT